MSKTQIWAFGAYRAPSISCTPECFELLRKSIENGKSRLGWSAENKYNLKNEKWTDQDSKCRRLLQIEKGDWIVHINMPEYGKCTAVKVTSEYDFDEGILNGEKMDFRHYIEVEEPIVFDRNDPNVLPTVNLKPRRRLEKILAVDDFLQSIANLKEGTVKLPEGQSGGEYHLKEKIHKKELLSQISGIIHEMFKGKKLEEFLAKVFRQIPNVENVENNGLGGPDYGADLIVYMGTPLWGGLDFDNKIIVQAKSYDGVHHVLGAVDQVVSGIEKFEGTAGMIITTAKKSEELEKKVEEASTELDKPIALLDSEDLAKFIIKYAPELIFEM